MSIEHVFPQERIEVIEGLEFTIREFYAREFPGVIALASLAARTDGTTEAAIAHAVEHESPRVFNLLSSVTGQPVETIQRLRGEVLLHIIELVMEENLDFFVRTLPKAMARMAEKVAGLTQSNS